MSKKVFALPGVLLLVLLVSCQLPQGASDTGDGGGTPSARTGSLKIIVPGTYIPSGALPGETVKGVRIGYALRSGSRIVASWSENPTDSEYDLFVSGQGYICIREGIPEGSDYELVVELYTPWTGDTPLCIGLAGAVHVIAGTEVIVTVPAFPVHFVDLSIGTDNNQWRPDGGDYALPANEEKWFRFGPLPPASGDTLAVSLCPRKGGMIQMAVFSPDGHYADTTGDFVFTNTGVTMVATAHEPATGYWYACLRGWNAEARIRFNYTPD